VPDYLLLSVTQSFVPMGDTISRLLKNGTSKQLPTQHQLCLLGLLCCQRLIYMLVFCLVAL